MREELKEIIKRAYIPYYDYAVAAMVVMKDGHKFYGANIENASFGASMCAERIAIFEAIVNGYHKGDFKSLVVMVNDDKLAFPCFLCRQVISEVVNMDCELILMNQTKEEHYKMSDIIVHPFDSENLQ